MADETRYGAVAIALHWLTALAVGGLLVVGQVMTSLPKGSPAVPPLFQYHKSVGISVLLLTLLRLAWRLAHRPPPLPTDLADWERRGANIVHWALYALLLALPLSGWAAVSASPLNIPTVLFGVVPWPHLPILAELPDKKPVAEFLGDLHGAGGTLMLLLAGLHTTAALWHQFYRKDAILTRMAPRFGRRRQP